MTTKTILRFKPKLCDLGPEPSLVELVFMFYRKNLPDHMRDEADEMAENYLDAVELKERELRVDFASVVINKLNLPHDTLMSAVKAFADQVEADVDELERQAREKAEEEAETAVFERMAQGVLCPDCGALFHKPCMKNVPEPDTLETSEPKVVVINSIEDLVNLLDHGVLPTPKHK